MFSFRKRNQGYLQAGRLIVLLFFVSVGVFGSTEEQRVQQWCELNQRLVEQFKQSEQLSAEQRATVRRQLMEQVRQQQLALQQDLQSKQKIVSSNTVAKLDQLMPFNLNPAEQTVWKQRRELLKGDLEFQSKLANLPVQQRAIAIQQWQQQRESKFKQLQQNQQALFSVKTKDLNAINNPVQIPPAPEDWNQAEQQLWQEHWNLRKEQQQMLAQAKDLPPNQRMELVRQWQEDKGQRQQDLQQWMIKTMKLNRQKN